VDGDVAIFSHSLSLKAHKPLNEHHILNGILKNVSLLSHELHLFGEDLIPMCLIIHVDSRLSQKRAITTAFTNRASASVKFGSLFVQRFGIPSVN
jgi:hypothetical protein